MALKKKVEEATATEETKAVEPEVTEPEVVEPVETEEIVPNDGELTPEEREALSGDGVEVPVANSKKLQLAMELLARQFNIDSTFYLTKSQDKGHSMTLGFSNMDYNVTIEIKNTDEMGFNDDYS